MRLAIACLIALSMLFAGPIGCIDFGVEDQQYVCRAQSECAEGFACLRGAGCYCLCQELGAKPNPTCTDPTCENVKTE